MGLWHISGDLTDTVREGWSLLLLLWGCLSLITMLGGGHGQVGLLVASPSSQVSMGTLDLGRGHCQ